MDRLSVCCHWRRAVVMDFDAVHTNAGEAGDNAHHADVASAVKRQASATDAWCLR